jgi:hypothetical protein
MSTLMGVTIWKSVGLSERVLSAIGLDISEIGVAGSGSARSVHSAVVGERIESSSHRL